MPKHKVRCELCTEIVATIDTETLKQPINGSMFKSHMAENGLDDPWPPQLTWEHLWCPYGGKHRPFQADRVQLEDGSYFDVPEYLAKDRDLAIRAKRQAEWDGKVVEVMHPPAGIDIGLKKQKRKAKHVRCPKCKKKYKNSEKGRFWLDRHVTADKCRKGK